MLKCQQKRGRFSWLGFTANHYKRDSYRTGLPIRNTYNINAETPDMVCIMRTDAFYPRAEQFACATLCTTSKVNCDRLVYAPWAWELCHHQI